MENILLRSDQKEIAILTLNSPKNLNALSEAMLDALKTNLEEIQRSKKIKAVIIRAAGKAFCPGHDLREMQAKRDLENDGGRAYFEDLLSRCTHVMKLIRELPQPVIAEIQGVAAAAGCQLVATCDIAVASEEASFGVNGVNIGLFCSTPMVALSRNITRKKAFEMLTTGDFLDPFQAWNGSKKSPVVSISNAFFLVMFLLSATIGVEQKRPIFTPLTPNEASSEATAISQVATN